MSTRTNHPWPQLRISVQEVPAHAPIRIRATLLPCPFGLCLIALGGDLLCQLSLPDSKASALTLLESQWPGATWDLPEADASALVRRIFEPRDGQRHQLDLGLRGTAFQIEVWKALLQIPYRHTASYQEIAAIAGHPSATRAAASAIGRNPIDIVIPCHRVIRKDGQLGHYHWGPELKRRILDWENGIL